MVTLRQTKTYLMMKNHTESGYGNKSIFIREFCVVGKFVITMLVTKHVYYYGLALTRQPP